WENSDLVGSILGTKDRARCASPGRMGRGGAPTTLGRRPTADGSVKSRGRARAKWPGGWGCAAHRHTRRSPRMVHGRTGIATEKRKTLGRQEKSYSGMSQPRETPYGKVPGAAWVARERTRQLREHRPPSFVETEHESFRSMVECSGPGRPGHPGAAGPPGP